MAHDPRAAQAMKKYQVALTEAQAMGPLGFAHMLDTADKDEIDDHLTAADVLLEGIQRTKALLAKRPGEG